jgi:hypothetical protein
MGNLAADPGATRRVKRIQTRNGFDCRITIMHYTLDYQTLGILGESIRHILNTLAIDALFFAAAYWVWRKAKQL